MDADQAIDMIRQIRDSGVKLNRIDTKFLESVQATAEGKIMKFPKGAYISDSQASRLNEIFDNKINKAEVADNDEDSQQAGQVEVPEVESPEVPQVQKPEGSGRNPHKP